ncbi:uncharacterized protein LOC141854787 [Brevipalpus obovatus]|uniref:uncharacterized protein LOC141854787 n=1 Tax=Brevipalpus obovatus TaxID=246614 RepID=UPI003D9F17A2
METTRRTRKTNNRSPRGVHGTTSALRTLNLNLARGIDGRWYRVDRIGGQEWIYRISKKKYMLAIEIFFEAQDPGISDQEHTRLRRLGLLNGYINKGRECSIDDKREPGKELVCRYCQKSFAKKGNLIRHEREICMAKGSPNNPHKPNIVELQPDKAEPGKPKIPNFGNLKSLKTINSDESQPTTKSTSKNTNSDKSGSKSGKSKGKKSLSQVAKKGGITKEEAKKWFQF